MNPTLQRILSLIDQNRIDEAFDEIDSLQIAYQPLAQLRQEFEGGYMSVNYFQRLKMVVKRFGKQFPDKFQKTPTPSYTISLDKPEQYIDYLTELKQQVRSSIDQEKSTRAIIEPLEEEGFEKIIGDRNNLKNINWLLKGLKASRSVCRVVRSNGEKGTGFVLEGGYLLTNWHVLPNVKAAENARIEFNYEQDADGNAQKVATYFLDTADCKFSALNAYDYTYVKIKDDLQNPLSQWGTLTIEDFFKPEIGQPTIIIQHPEGGIKQIAFEDNDILSVWKPYLFYKTDTLKGSSGSPVLNNDWKVVALHHYGKNEEEGGVIINEEGDKRPANRGILMCEIMKDLNKNICPSDPPSNP